MSKQKGLIIGVILVAIILMAIGYASVVGTTLNITAKANASANTDNFKVFFTGVVKEKSNETEGCIDVSAANESVSATVSFNKTLGLNTKGQKAHAILEIKNGSAGIDAESVKVTTNGIDTNIFDFEAIMCDENGTEIQGDNPVASGATTYVKVSVELLASPTDDIENVETTITLTATPKSNVPQTGA